jgi:hypothetical protein
MNFCQPLTACLLLAAATTAQSDAAVHLTTDANQQLLQLRALRAGSVFVVVGERAVPPIQVAGVELDVVPEAIAPLGRFKPFEFAEWRVPRQTGTLHAEALLVDDAFQLHDSNVVALADAHADLIARTFRAVLVSTDSIPPLYTLGAALTAPTSGYELKVDSHRTVEQQTNVYLRLSTPADNELVLPVLEEHAVTVDLGSDVGSVVNVLLLRDKRGAVEPEVYRLMVSIPVGDKVTLPPPPEEGK